MRIDGSIPSHVAQAYGLKHVRPGGAAERAHAPQPGEATGAVQPAAQAPPTAPSTGIKQLIAGQVAGPINFAPTASSTDSPAALPFYTRSADRVEAATGVQLGRQLDVKA